jgi:hypothetical protein
MMTEPEEAMCRRFAAEVMSTGDTSGTITRDDVAYAMRGLGGCEARVTTAVDFTWSIVDYAQQYGLEVR